MEAQMGKEPGNQEEGRHPEDVDDKEQHAERHAGMTVLDDPDPGWCRNERNRRVQDDAEQQGKAPDRIEGMQTFRRLRDMRHGTPRDGNDKGIGPCILPDRTNPFLPDREIG